MGREEAKTAPRGPSAVRAAAYELYQRDTGPSGPSGPREPRERGAFWHFDISAPTTCFCALLEVAAGIAPAELLVGPARGGRLWDDNPWEWRAAYRMSSQFVDELRWGACGGVGPQLLVEA